MNSLEQIKNKPFVKIGLITEPPDFSFEKQIDILRNNYDFIQVPTLLTDINLIVEFNELTGMNITDGISFLKELSTYEFYENFIDKHAAFVLKKMAETHIFKASIYHLPPVALEYSKYFDKVIILNNDGVINEELLIEHVTEEDFPIEIERALIETQRKHFAKIQ
jgi:hypothetical protein